MGVASAPAARSWLGHLILLIILVTGCGRSVADADTTGTVASQPAGSTRAAGFCAAVRANADAIRPLNQLTLTGPIHATGDGLTGAVEAARISGTVLVDAAPGDIRAAVVRTVAAMNSELNALLAAGGDAAKAARDPAVAAELNSAEVAAASRQVSTYVNQNCAAK